MSQRCLLIADDLTGAADAGAQFAKRGLRTLLISLLDDAKIDFSKYTHRDVLVINTDSRGLSPEKAFLKVSNLLKRFDQKLFPIIYKKIDSTLRGNVGYEIDAILKETKESLCFMAPSYPEQNRTLVGGILIVGEKPLALTEVAQNTASPIQESHVYKILQNQSQNSVGWIDLTHVASSHERLRKTVDEERKKGDQIIIFDAVSRGDLKNIVETAFYTERIPLFVGSAGLAEEVAKKLTPSREKTSQKMKPFKHILVVSGTASSVTHQQLGQVARRPVPSFRLNRSLITGEKRKTQEEKKELTKKIANALSQGIAILKAPSEMLSSKDSTEPPIHLQITKTLASVALLALEASKIKPAYLALILTGGETAQNVINGLEPEGIEIEGELLEGIVRGHLIGGDWDGLTVVPKAGAFGKEDALERIVEMLKAGSPSTKEGI
jgi:D-threonate/D-erythronate kinase